MVVPSRLESNCIFDKIEMFRRGHGTPQNWSKALEYYRKAADRGNQRARQQLEELED